MDSSSTYRIVLICHGRSIWSEQDRITGWSDVELSAAGIKDAQLIGEKLKEAQISFDACFTSVLKRTVQTWNIIADILDQHCIAVRKSWRLNDKHFGSLQGMERKELIARHGQGDVYTWSNSYETPPPPLSSPQIIESRFKKAYPMSFPLTEVIKQIAKSE